MGQIDSAKKIDDFSKRFAELRTGLDSAIGLNINKKVDEIGMYWTLFIVDRIDNSRIRIPAKA